MKARYPLDNLCELPRRMPSALVDREVGLGVITQEATTMTRINRARQQQDALPQYRVLPSCTPRLRCGNIRPRFLVHI